ncbi:unnamed protein product, partial [Amoebophrya sp. A25]
RYAGVTQLTSCSGYIRSLFSKSGKSTAPVEENEAHVVAESLVQAGGEIRIQVDKN